MKRLIHPFIFSIILIFIACEAHPQESTEEKYDDEGWKLITKAKSGNEYYLDMAKVITTKENVFGEKKIWVKEIETKKTVKNGKTSVVKTKTLSLFEIKCSSSEYRVVKEVVYNSKGTVIRSKDFYNSYDTPVPDSIGEAVFEAVCN